MQSKTNALNLNKHDMQSKKMQIKTNAMNLNKHAIQEA